MINYHGVSINVTYWNNDLFIIGIVLVYMTYMSNISTCEKFIINMHEENSKEINV
jgi:hypothetical protein